MKKRFRRSMSLVLAAAVTASCMATGFVASAADSYPPVGVQARANAQPHFSGYRMKDVRNWDSETDPYADMMRAKVPLQERNEVFAPTQANPDLASDAKIMLMQGDYGNSFFDSMLYNNSFSEHVLNFWQYADYYCPWHGAATASTPSALYDPVTSDWRSRGFEFGMLNIPNPAYTNAAHKNGVLSIGCLYFDQAFRPGQSINELLEKDSDGNFLLVDKLVEIANYYGFDGYFLNREDYPSSMDDLHEFMRQMTAKGMYTQYYDTGSSFSEAKGNFIKNGNYNSIFFNYGGWGSAKNAYNWCNSNGLDVYSAAFFGVECNQGKFSSNVITSGYMPGTKNLYASVALFTPSDYYQRGVDDNIGTDRNMPKMQQAQYQWMVTERERMFFSGVTQDPTDTGMHSGFSRPDLGIGNAGGWVGAADFTSERSVVSGSTFYTNFNTGHGMQMYDNGEVSVDDEWANINIQDILPSWQWWMETDGTKLNVDFDYGQKEVRFDKNGNAMTLPYTQVGGYKGGSSLAVYGDIDAENFLHLYKTDLSVKEGTKVSITYNKTSATDSSVMEIGVLFKNEPDAVVTFDVPRAGQQTDGWVTKNVTIPEDYAGEEIAAIGLVFRAGKAGVQGYQMNIGELKVTDGENYTPAAPSNLKIKNAYDSKEMVLTWDLGDYDEIDQYNVYANLSDGSRAYLGGIYDNVYYVKNTMASDIVTMEVTAVGQDGTESEPASIDFAYNQNVSNIVVEEGKDVNNLKMQATNAGYLDVSWTNPNVDYKELKLGLSLVDTTDDRTYSMTVGKDVDSTRFYIPRGHGEFYDLTISTVFEDGSESEPISYRSMLKDVWSQPMDVEDVHISGNKVWFTNPASVDWYRIHGYVNGAQVFNQKRGSNSINSNTTLPGNKGVLEIVLEDYCGNMSAPLYVPYGGGSESSSGGSVQVNENTFPDAALLAAVKDQIGDTPEAIKDFTGTLDLSNLDIQDYTGLDKINAAVIDLTGSNLTSVQKGTFGPNVDKVILNDSKDLTYIYPGTFTDTNVKEIEITGCTALQVIGFNDSNLEKIVCEDAADMTDVISVDMSGSRFDLSAGTPEKAFADAMAVAAEGKEDIVLTDPAESNLALNAAIVEDQTTISKSSARQLFDGVLDYFMFYAPNTIVCDLGSERTVTSWKLYNDTYVGYGLVDFEIYGSNDANEYTLISSVTGNSSIEVSQTVENPQPYRYYKLEAIKSMSNRGDMRELELYGHEMIVYAAGVQTENQRPRILPAELDPTILTEKKNGTTIDLVQALADAKAKAAETSQTVRGTSVAQLTGADFIDPDYEMKAETVKERDIHMIEVTDRDGNFSRDTIINSAVDNVYTVKYITYDSANLEGEALYTFTVKVRGITSILEEIIAEAERLQAAGALENTMEAVVNEFNAALEEARMIVEKDDASQKEINDSTLRLLAAIAKVDWKQGDKTILEIAVEVATSIEGSLDLYVEAGKQEFKDALAEARELLASGNAWQDDINDSVVRLTDAMKALRMTPNKDILNDMIANAKAMDLSAYTADTANAVRAALAAAEAVAADANADQKAVDAAANTLDAALKGLVVVNGSADNNAADDNANAGTTAPVGEGTTPTKTGDSPVAGLAALALMSAAAVVLLKKRQR